MWNDVDTWRMVCSACRTVFDNGYPPITSRITQKSQQSSKAELSSYFNGWSICVPILSYDLLIFGTRAPSYNQSTRVLVSCSLSLSGNHHICNLCSVRKLGFTPWCGRLIQPWMTKCLLFRLKTFIRIKRSHITLNELAQTKATT